MHLKALPVARPETHFLIPKRYPALFAQIHHRFAEIGARPLSLITLYFPTAYQYPHALPSGWCFCMPRSVVKVFPNDILIQRDHEDPER